MIQNTVRAARSEWSPWGRPLASLVAGVAFLLGTAAATPAISADSTPRGAIEDTVAEVLKILRDASLDKSTKTNRIESVAKARFDFQTMARLALARSWASLQPAEQDQFIVEFQRHLSVTYGRNVDRYSNEEVEITGDREEARGDWVVKTKIFRSNDNILVDYRLRKMDDAWKVIDVVIEGVSLIANFRSQFQEIAASQGAPRIVTLLKEKNSAGESLIEPLPKRSKSS